MTVAVIGWGLPASATIIYNNGSADGSRGWWSDFDGVVQQMADGFILSTGNNTITGVNWSGSYYSTNTPTVTDNFLLSIFNNSGGVPDINPIYSFSVGNAVNRVDSGVNDATWKSDIYNYSAAIPSTMLVAGTTYWLSVVNNTTGHIDDWLWENSVSTGSNAFRNGDGNGWTSFDTELAFQLIYAPVPEPETYAMMLAGLGLFGLMARRRKIKIT